MHETVYANKVIEEGKKLGVDREIEIEVGELCDITDIELKEAIESMIDWAVYSREVESRVQCACGYEGKAHIIDKGHGYCYFECPRCKAMGKDLKIVEGGEIKIVGVG